MDLKKLKEEQIKLSKKVIASSETLTIERGYDCSINDSILISLPNEEMIQSLQLDWNGMEGCFFNKKGQRIVFDPSMVYSAPKSLLVRYDSLFEFMKEKDYEIFWTVIGEKMVYGKENFTKPIVSGRGKFNGVYRFDPDGKIISNSNPEFIPYPNRD